MIYNELKEKLYNLGFREVWYYKNTRFLYLLNIKNDFDISVEILEDLSFCILDIEYCNDIDYYNDKYKINKYSEIQFFDIYDLYLTVNSIVSKFLRKEKLEKWILQ